MSHVSYDDFAKLDIRVAKIISTEQIPGKTRIIKGIIDLGNETRTVIIGGAQYYKPEDIIANKTSPAVIALWAFSPTGTYTIPAFGI